MKKYYVVNQCTKGEWYFRQYVIGGCAVNLRKPVYKCETDDDTDKWEYRVSYTIDDYTDNEKPYRLATWNTIDNLMISLKEAQGI